MAAQRHRTIERHLTIGEVAELLGTTDRFPRRLIGERRIRFVRVGRHVRIPESAVRELQAYQKVLERSSGGGVGSGQSCS